MDLKDFCKKLGIKYSYEHEFPLLYEDELIALFGYDRWISQSNPNLSLCDNLDYKNDERQLILDDGFGKRYKLTGDHLDQIRGKMIQIPRMFNWDEVHDIITVKMAHLHQGCIISMLTLYDPLVIWFKNCKIIKEDMENVEKGS